MKNGALKHNTNSLKSLYNLSPVFNQNKEENMAIVGHIDCVTISSRYNVQQNIAVVYNIPTYENIIQSNIEKCVHFLPFFNQNKQENLLILVV